MYCTKCGTENIDNDNYCRECGSRLLKPCPGCSFRGAPFLDGNYNGLPNSGQGANGSVQREDPRILMLPSSTPASREQKALFSSPTFLAAVIIFTLSAIFSLLSSIFKNDLLSFAISSRLGHINRQAVNLIVNHIPAIISAVALWITYATAKSRYYTCTSTVGFTLLCITYVFSIITAAVNSVLIIFKIIIPTIATNDLLELIVSLLMILAIFLITTVIIVFLASLIKLSKISRDVSLKGKCNGEISIFIPIALFVISFFNLYDLIRSGYLFSAVLLLNLPSIISALSSLLSTTAFLMLGIITVIHKSRLSSAKHQEKREQYLSGLQED